MCFLSACTKGVVRVLLFISSVCLYFGPLIEIEQAALVKGVGPPIPAVAPPDTAAVITDNYYCLQLETCLQCTWL